MRLLLRKCGICEHWYMPEAHHNHCPACGSAPIGHVHVDSATGRVIANGIRLMSNASVIRGFEK